MERWDAPVQKIVMVWWPVSVYFGWVTIATVANVSLYLTKLNWDGSPLTPADLGDFDNITGGRHISEHD